MSDGTDHGTRWQRVDLPVRGMACRHAVRSVTARLRDVVGVETVVADVRTGLVTVTGTMSVADLVAALGGSPDRATAPRPVEPTGA